MSRTVAARQSPPRVRKAFVVDKGSDDVEAVSEFYKSAVFWALAFADKVAFAKQDTPHHFEVTAAMGSVFTFRRDGHWAATGVVKASDPTKWLSETECKDDTRELAWFERGDATLLRGPCYPDWEAFNKAMGARPHNDDDYDDEEDMPRSPFVSLVVGVLAQVPEDAIVTNEILEDLQDMFTGLFVRGATYEDTTIAVEELTHDLERMMFDKHNYGAKCMKLLDAALSPVHARLSRANVLGIADTERFEADHSYLLDRAISNDIERHHKRAKENASAGAGADVV